MTKKELIAELKKEYDEELGFFKRIDGKVAWNPRALMLWGLYFEGKYEPDEKTVYDFDDAWEEELLEKGEVTVKIRL